MSLVQLFDMMTECGGEAAGVPAELERDVRGERVRGGVGAGGRLRAGRLGKRQQLRQAERHVRALRQMLPVSAEGARGTAPPYAGAPLAREWLDRELTPRGNASRRKEGSPDRPCSQSTAGYASF